MSQRDKSPKTHQRLIDVDVLKRIDVSDDLSLQLLDRSDAVAVLSAIGTDPAIRERVYVASLMNTPEDVEKQVADMHDDGELLRYVIRDHDEIIGMVNFWRAGDFFGALVAPDVCGIGYFLVPSARGRGILTDVIKMFLGVVQRNIPVPEFIAFCEDDNLSSSAVLERVGFLATDETIDFSKLGVEERKYVMKVNQD